MFQLNKIAPLQISLNFANSANKCLRKLESNFLGRWQKYSKTVSKRATRTQNLFMTPRAITFDMLPEKLEVLFPSKSGTRKSHSKTLQTKFAV